MIAIDRKYDAGYANSNREVTFPNFSLEYSTYKTYL